MFCNATQALRIMSLADCFLLLLASGALTANTMLLGNPLLRVLQFIQSHTLLLKLSGRQILWSPVVYLSSDVWDLPSHVVRFVPSLLLA